MAFTYPADWEIISDTLGSDTPCSFTLRPRRWQELLIADDRFDAYSTSIRAYATDVWSQAAASGFGRRDGDWIVLGRHGHESPADAIAGAGWRGLRGAPVSGCYKVMGDYVGICSTSVAVLGTDVWALSIVASAEAEDVFDQILATIRVQP